MVVDDPLVLQRLLSRAESSDWVDIANVFRELRRLKEKDPSTANSRRQHLLGEMTANKGKPAPLAVFRRWVQAEPDNPDAHLLRGEFLVGAAWNVRTTCVAALVTEVQYAIFESRLAEARNELQKAIELDPADPLPYGGLLTVGMGSGRSKTELWRIFEDFQINCASDIHHPEVHRKMLYSLTPKWGGSMEQLLAFARDSTLESASPPPPRHALWTLLCQAHLYGYENATRRLPKRHWHSYWLDSKVREDVVQSYEQFCGPRAATNSTRANKETSNRCSNQFAFCLWKVKAHDLALVEMQKILESPLEDVWKHERGVDWKVAHQAAWKEAVQALMTTRN